MGWAIDASIHPDLREQEEALVRLLIQTLQADRVARMELVDVLLDNAAELDRLFDLWSEWWRSFLLAQEGVPGGEDDNKHALVKDVELSISPQEAVGVIKRIDETREWVRANVNVRLALETLALHLPEAS
jgi:hypothetical protein